jgi:hypothetical protein
MITEIDNLIKSVNSKPTWSTKELLPKLQAASSQLENTLSSGGQIVNVSAGKKNKVQTIQKYDILYLPLIGIPHYFMVHKVIDQVVYGIIFTSTDKSAFCIHEVKKDRILEGSFAANTYLSADLAEAKNSFIRTFENKAEADQIFGKIAQHYQSIFKLK